MANLQVGYLFGKGWAAFKDNIGLAILVMIIHALISNLGNLGKALDSSGLESILTLVGIIIAGPLYAGVVMVYLKIARGEDAVVGDMFAGFSEFVKAFGVYILVMIAVVIGLILLVVPGIIVALGLFPVMFLVLDENLGVVDTLKRGWEMMDGNKGSIFILFLALFGLNILGALALVIGLFITIPLSSVITAVAYDEIAGRKAQAVRPDYPPMPENPAPPIG